MDRDRVRERERELGTRGERWDGHRESEGEEGRAYVEGYGE